VSDLREKKNIMQEFVKSRKSIILLGRQFAGIFSLSVRIISMKITALVDMCSDETYSRIRIGENQSNIFTANRGLKKECLSPLLLGLVYNMPIVSSKVNNGD
jgi:hypothetical protein